MTLFETASELHLRLAAAREADTGDQLLSRARSLRAHIASGADHLEAVGAYRIAISRTDMPSFNGKSIRQAIGYFRRALSNSGPKAVQQQSAATLVEVLTAQTKRVDRWVRSTWREENGSAQELLSRVDSGDLHGSPADRFRAQRRARKIRSVLNTNPVSERAALEEALRVEGLKACLERVDQLIDDLRSVIASIDKKQKALTPEVRAALQRAASRYGLPLGEVTPELLDAFQSAGVLDDLVVNQR